jgi:hypothetical protein
MKKILLDFFTNDIALYAVDLQEFVQVLLKNSINIREESST